MMALIHPSIFLSVHQSINHRRFSHQENSFVLPASSNKNDLSTRKNRELQNENHVISVVVGNQAQAQDPVRSTW
jgi:hypothetical protein